MLDLEGDEPANDNKLNEFRQNNIALQQKLAEQEARQKSIEEALAKFTAGAAPAGKQPATVEEKVSHLTNLFEQSKKETEAARAAARQESWRSLFLGAAQKHKVRDDSAASALFALAQSTFKEKDGAFVPLDAKGATIYSKTGTDPLSVDEWMEQQRGGGYRDLFAQPTGGGAKGAGGLGGVAGRITLTREEAQKPTVAQFTAMQKGLADIED